MRYEKRNLMRRSFRINGANSEMKKNKHIAVVLTLWILAFTKMLQIILNAMSASGISWKPFHYETVSSNIFIYIAFVSQRQAIW